MSSDLMCHEDTSPIMGAPTSWPYLNLNTSQMPHHQVTSPWGQGSDLWILEGYKLQSIKGGKEKRKHKEFLWALPLYTCVCGGGYMYLCVGMVYVGTCMWTRTCVCLCVEARGATLNVFPQLFPILVFETGLLLNWELTALAKMLGQWVPWIFLPICFQRLDYKLITRLLESWTQDLMLVQESTYWLNHLPSIPLHTRLRTS